MARASAGAEAQRQHATVLRLDCWAGGDGRLIQYCVAAGFRPTERFHVGSWRPITGTVTS